MRPGWTVNQDDWFHAMPCHVGAGRGDLPAAALVEATIDAFEMKDSYEVARQRRNWIE